MKRPTCDGCGKYSRPCESNHASVRHHCRDEDRPRIPSKTPGVFDLVCPKCLRRHFNKLPVMPAAPPRPAHYADRPTATLQARREVLLRIPRDFTPDERTELRAIEAELQARNVLSIGLDF